MIKLPKNPVNTIERMNEGVEKLMTYVCKQIEYCLEHKDGNSNVVAIVKTGSEYSKGVRCGVMEEWFANDIIKNAVPMIKEQGYFVWHHSDYRGDHSYWITTTPNCPHTWYSMI